ncbi:MAG: DUF2975 domain-containing protein [Cyclobacteriaceae bacterium]|uniref:DUF2975 domain-containing protein n=1 Tax=Algoriphagus marincola TaxID=264027 RepID=UPI0004175989|nr:DUF2975 domain-containing protein [Algoriphagus marincola]MCR9084564.1 DUF2975 domain-containing protein [Cyclobacteriaceae bacterium]
MKLTKILLLTTYISLVIGIIAFVIFGFFFVKMGFNDPKFDHGSLEGVISKSKTSTFKLPMNMEVNYFLRIKDSEVLVDSYFFKIKKKYISKSFLSEAELPETDYPTPIKENIYSMPASDSFLYVKTDYSTVETSLIILTSYFILSFVLLLGGISLIIQFLRNCDSGDFFISQNGTYLRVISYLAIIYVLIDYGSQWLIFQNMNSKIEDSFSVSLNPDLEFNWKYLIFSLFLVIIAQAFTEGTKLKEEHSLTI